jgi:hypothetical protein
MKLNKSEVSLTNSTISQIITEHFTQGRVKVVAEATDDKIRFCWNQRDRNQPKGPIAKELTRVLREHGFSEFSIRVDRHGAFEIRNRDFLKELEAWVNDPTVTGDKETARERLIEAYHDDSTMLILVGLNLSKLPSVIGELTRLERLYLSGNKLTTLPNEIGNLTQLQKLSLPENKLVTLPPSIGNLTHLQWLYVHSNELTTLPDEIWTLPHLEHLELSNNELTTLSPQIGNLSQLQRLDLSNNPLTALPTEIGSLTHLELLTISYSHRALLPISLGNTRLTDIQYANDPQLDRTLINQILNLARVRRDEQSAALFPATLELWKTYANSQEDLSFLLSQDSHTISTLQEFLFRLSKTRDFQRNQHQLAQIVCAMLADLKKNDEYKTHFLAEAESNNRRCQDRTAMTFNVLFTLWKIYSLDLFADTKDKLDLFVKAAKTICLRKHIAQVISNHCRHTHSIENESVEIYLYVETQLKQSLDLLSPIDFNAYADTIGRKSYIHLEEIKRYVQDHYLDELVELDRFIELAKTDVNLRTKFKALESSYLEKTGQVASDSEIERDVLAFELNEKKRNLLKQWIESQIAQALR